MDEIYLAVAAATGVGFCIGSYTRHWFGRHERRIDKAARAIVEGMPGHGWSNDPEGRFTYVSPPALKYYGVEEKDIRLMERNPHGFHDAYVEMLAKLIHPDDLPGTLENWAETLSSGDPATYEYRLRRHDGVYRWHRLAVHPSRNETGTITAWYGTQIDIEDQKVAQLELQWRKQSLERLIDAVPVNIWTCTPSGDATYFSRRLQDLIGYSPDSFDPSEDLFRQSNNAIIHPDDVRAAEASLKNSLETGAPLSGRWRIRKADGSYIWTEQRAEAFKDVDGNIIEWIGLAIDIDEFKREEDAVRYREQELQLLIDTIPMMIWTAKYQDGPLFFSKPLLEYTGLGDIEGTKSTEAFSQQTMHDLIHPDDVTEIRAAFNRGFVSGEVMTVRYRFRRSDGVYRWVESRSASSLGKRGETMRRYGCLIDVHEEVEANSALQGIQERLVKASRASSLAELSAAIAHEVNQPLSAIVSNAEACRRWLSAVPPNVVRALGTADLMVKDAKDAAEVISCIRSLFQQVTVTRQPEKIEAVIKEVCGVFNNDPRAKIKVQTDFSVSAPDVMMDRVQIQQVLVNLIRNAIEATDVSGVCQSTVIVLTRMDAEGVVVEVRDQGTGLPSDKRVGQAFFTTKPGGTGMGLVICRSIVEAHGGKLESHPNRPRGTTFLFTIPTGSSVAS